MLESFKTTAKVKDLVSSLLEVFSTRMSRLKSEKICKRGEEKGVKRE